MGIETIAAVVTAVVAVAGTATTLATAGGPEPAKPPQAPPPTKLAPPPAQTLAPAAPQPDEQNLKAQEAQAQAVSTARRARTNTAITSPIGAPQSAQNLTKTVLGG